jgi:SAM-dependent methyltransferase
MSKNPAKDFGQIADDYAFFETHATEAEQDAAAYAKLLAEIVPADETIRMLDFGCGSGSFTARLLDKTCWPPERMRLTAVEPVAAARQQAVARLTGFTHTAIADSTTLPDGIAGCFDVVLSNHVLYYVPELADRLRKLIDALSPSGVFLTAIAGRTNALIQFWIAGFGLSGREIPYNTSEDVEAALRDLGVRYAKQEVPYELTFPDTEQNRMRIVRFLFGDYLASMPIGPLLDLFDPYSRDGRIEIRTASDHFTIQA